MNDELIRDAVAELVATAPTPKPFPRTASVSAISPPERSYRWLALTAAAVLLIGGVVAVAAWRASQDTAPTTDTLPSAPTTEVSVTTLPVTQVPAVPPTTQPASPSTVPTTEPAAGVTTFEIAPIPTGTFQFGLDDVIATRVDGDLWWYPGLLGDSPGDPVRLLDMGDPREPVSEGPGPNTVSFVAGAINGTLVYGTCCEPASGDLRVLTGPDGDPNGMPYGAGWDTAISPDGTRMISAGYGFVFYDLTAGTGSVLDDPTAPMYESVAWSPDGSAFALLGYEAEGGWFIETRSAVAPYEVLRRVALGLPAPSDTMTKAKIIEWGGLLWVASDDGSGIKQHAFYNSLDEATQDLDFEQLPAGATSVHADRDGRRLVVADGRLLFESRELAADITDAWFVPSFEVAAVGPTEPVAAGERVTPRNDDEAAVLDYLYALADGRYDDAGALLTSGALEDERRADLRPLYHEFPDIANGSGITDISDALRRWCEGPGLCAEPTLLDPIAGTTGRYVVRFPGARDEPFGYFGVGMYEGQLEVTGLPPYEVAETERLRVQCPTDRVQRVRFADLDGDGRHETVVLAGNTISVCGTNLAVEPVPVGSAGEPAIVVVDDGEDGVDELLVGTSGPDATSVHRVALSNGRLLGLEGPAYVLTYPPLPTGTPGQWTSFGCERIAGTSEQFVEYLYTLAGGDSLDTATSIDIDVYAAPHETDTDILTHLTFELPGERDEAMRLLDPRCAGLPLFTDGW